jgi:hypothetical protein
MAKSEQSKGTAVLVTTEHRGVFFGHLVGEPSKEKVLLTDARNVLRWTESERGFLGLASAGPGKNCRVGPKVPELTLWDITSVATVSEEALAAWEKSPWA